MPTDLSDAETGGPSLVFADDLQGTVFQLAEPKIYDADEVSDPGRVPEFGEWIPAQDADGREVWLVAVSELVEELQTVDAPGGDTFEITRCEKSGPKQTDPYEVNLETLADGDQSRLSGA